MRVAHYVLYGIAVLQASTVTSADVQRRADVSITSSGENPSGSPSPTPVSGSSSGFASTVSGSQSSSAVASSSSDTPKSVSSTASADQSSTSSIEALPTSSIKATAQNASSNGLPLQPIITPAIGIAGAVMVLTGIVYGLLGIKSKEMYNFLSVAYLASLAVTVLVLYVMNPPVSNAVQGAYFVAATITGLIFGALAAVFNDLTDGLGCALGGFCVSMWILTLVEGGSIQSKGGKVGFIMGCTCVAYALSFVHYTREYVLLGCISFAGATVMILGIDCFSRTGYKEFWIYIWDLNTDEFPLGTTTYPINRGMRVETAGVILLFLLGLVTQSKLYQKLKQRRERRDVEAAHDAETREMRESAIAKSVMDHVSRDTARWNSIYDRERTESTTDGIGSHESMRKGSASVSERPVSDEEVELTDLSGSRELNGSEVGINKGVPQGGVTVTVTEAGGNDDIQPIDYQDNPINTSKPETNGLDKPKPSFETSGPPSNNLETLITPNSNNGSHRSSVRQSILVPPVMPLPFTVPTGADEAPNKTLSNPGSGIGSISRNRSSKRKSTTSSVRRTSFQSLQDAGPSQEDLIPPHDEEDRASSIAATIDLLDIDELSPDALSEPRSPLDQNFGAERIPAAESSEHPPWERTQSAPEMDTKESNQPSKDSELLKTDIERFRKSTAESFRLSILSDGDEERLRADEAQEELKSSDSASRPISLQDPPRERRYSLKSAAAKSEASHPESLANLRDSVPELPKNLIIYRTNEWAKHAADADAPVIEEIERPESPGVQILHERPAISIKKPIAMAVVSETSIREPASNQSSAQIVTHSPSSQSTSNSPLSRTPSVPNLPNAMIPGSDRPSGSRNSSTTNVSQPITPGKRSQLRGSRNFSAPMPGTAVQEEISEGAALGHRRQDTDVLTPLPSDTLLDKRSSKLKQRISTSSFAGSMMNVPTYAFSATPELNRPMSPITPDDSASVRNASFENPNIDPDNIPLAERKAQLLRQSSGSSIQFSQQGTWPLPQHEQAIPFHAMNSLPSQQYQRPWTQHYNSSSGQLKRDSYEQRPKTQHGNSNYSQRRQDSNEMKWRDSINKEMTQERPLADEGRRMLMLESKRRSEAMQQYAETEKRNFDDAFDRTMRSGLMVNRHNELMRKMQASVPKEC